MDRYFYIITARYFMLLLLSGISPCEMMNIIDHKKFDSNASATIVSQRLLSIEIFYCARNKVTSFHKYRLRKRN